MLKPEYAEQAILEALVNHFIHLDIYDDPLEVSSPGGMYSGQLIQELDIHDVHSDRRNPILADVMAQNRRTFLSPGRGTEGVRDQSQVQFTLN